MILCTINPRKRDACAETTSEIQISVLVGCAKEKSSEVESDYGHEKLPVGKLCCAYIDLLARCLMS